MDDLIQTALLAVPMAWLATEGGKAALSQAGLRWQVRGKDTRLWQWGVRVLATVAGLCCGYYLGDGAPQHVLAGGAGGVLCTTAMVGLRQRIKALASGGAAPGGDDEPPPPGVHA